MNHFQILNKNNNVRELSNAGCGRCQCSCQSACKITCVVANQECENEEKHDTQI
ncbi:MAG: six-cysteine ranthipeptide SCIFF [Candidatus Improbicoccus pseudotrichonymphae]|uniref:Six-cysteine ranthipeptide SCIFF n=1 Tax=Candidatus Improbicoccus pseudotrichonymphae TaxID=3033792 RepID=A0AA48KYK8_9FIRM|nr:MAG: six-cysteine ranthipeptide SCIFF [Candidatus Improbicoccus pseudotrichonymphae]